jgi:DNA-binding response OmpR family regulator
MLDLKYRILSVQSDLELKTDLSGILVSEGYEFDMVSNAELGYRKLQKQHYDLVISEILLENDKMSGLDLLQKIRENNLDIPFIVISDISTIELSVKAINYGVAGYLVKPISIEETKEAIQQSIRHHKSRFLKNELVNYQMENAFQAVISSKEQSILKLLDTVDNLIEMLYPTEYGSFPDLKMAIYEGLSNAAEHGNHNQAEKNIYFKINMTMDKIIVQIKDEGVGFDWSAEVIPQEEIQATHRGLGLIRHLMDEVTFSIKGNEINLLKILD